MAAIMVHGRGRDADDILGIADRLELADVAYLAPTAFEKSWYPNRFMEPIERNQPRLDQALERVDTLVGDLLGRGFDPARIILLGFSQGGCLISEYAVRNTRRYGGVVAFTGGLIGPPGTQWNSKGKFEGTPVFLGTSDIDEWVPEMRVQETARVLRRMGAIVELMIYKGMEHVVNDGEISRARELIRRAGNPAR
ncbi:MAG: dienelactone hydrolase family protein [Gammaproteobacteria bacterium]|nr:dienelactone hydrolase family protein [Gammaproteobacteria bacterium]